jgi:UDP-glucose 4-epimerase
MVVDNLSAGRRMSLPAEGTTGFSFRATDLADGAELARLIGQFVPEICIHLAAVHFIPLCRARPAHTIRSNILGTQNLIDALAAVGNRPRLVLASTADVYRPDTLPHSEDSPCSPDNVYGLSKLNCEQLVSFAADDELIEPVVVRLFNVYGPGETNPHLFPEIIDQLQQGPHLNLGNASPRRDYVYVDDVADLVVALGAWAAPGTVTNIGSGESHSVLDIVAEIADLIAQEVTVHQDPARVRQSDRPNLQADVRRLRSIAPWATPTRLPHGLRRLLRSARLFEDVLSPV